MANTRNIKARKKLAALYKRGVALRFGPDGGKTGPFDEKLGDDEVELLIQPPNPLQRAQALREAQAARALAMIAVKKRQDSEEYLTSKAFLAEMSDDTLVEYLVEAGVDNRRTEAMREVLSRDEWEDFTSLQDAMRKFDESGDERDDPKWADLFERDKAFGDQLREKMHELADADRASLKMLPREEAERRGLEKRGELVASQRFVEEYERWMAYYAIRDPENPDQMFFEDPDEFEEQDDLVQELVHKTISEFINDGAEAKNSPRAASGSEPSALPSEPETSAPSTQEKPNE